MKFLIVGLAFFLTMCVPLWGDEYQSPRYERILHPDSQHAILQTAACRFTHPQKGDVWLIAALHMSPKSYYQSLQPILDSCDVVLFECATNLDFRPDTSRPEKTLREDNQRRLSALAAMVAEFYYYHKRFPKSFAEMRKNLVWLGKSVYVHVLNGMSIDAYGKPFEFHLTDSGLNFTRDSRFIIMPKHVANFQPPPDPGRILANILGYVTQQSAIRYDKRNFEHCDLDAKLTAQKTAEKFKIPVEQVLRERATMNSGESEKIIRAMTHATRVNPKFRNLLRYMLVLQSGNFEKDLEEAAPSMRYSVITLRNEHILKRLAQITDGDKRAYGVFFGAGHMPPIAERLVNCEGYKPAETLWFSAYDGDLKTSDLSPDEIHTWLSKFNATLKNGAHP